MDHHGHWPRREREDVHDRMNQYAPWYNHEREDFRDWMPHHGFRSREQDGDWARAWSRPHGDDAHDRYHSWADDEGSETLELRTADEVTSLFRLNDETWIRQLCQARRRAPPSPRHASLTSPLPIDLTLV
jgi:hypothetical protein